MSGQPHNDLRDPGAYAIEAGLTVNELAASWNPYLTIGEAIHLAAQAFTRDVSKLSCCAA